jgi:hypothetical protein
MFIIVCLAVLAVYQVSRLWIAIITSRGFSYESFSELFMPNRELAVSGTLPDMAKPWRIISGAGDERFYVRYSNINDSREKAYADYVLEAVIEDGRYVAEEPRAYDALLDRPAIVYEYRVSLPADTFTGAYGLPSGPLTSADVAAFSKIVVHPPVNGGDADVYFLNGGSSARFSLSAVGREDDGINFEITPAEGYGLHYIRIDNDYVAIWPYAEFQQVEVANPYISLYGDRLLSHIRSCVELLFDNPSTVRESISADGEMTFSNANTVVRYLPRDVLEYANYRIADRPETGFNQDYMAALSFIYADNYVVNEFYLAGYDLVNGQRTFRFDYVINDFPMIMMEGWPDEADSGHAIEVVVDRGLVVKYKKLAHNFHLEGTLLTDRFVYDAATGGPPVLGYRIANSQSFALEYINRAVR